MQRWQALVLTGCGGGLYVLIELLYRGRSHISMFLTGGICFWAIGMLNELWPGAPLSIQAVLGGAMIVAAEFATGLIVNRWLGLGVWDYSGAAHNVMGQICLPFAAWWAVLAAGAAIADDLLRLALFGQALRPVVFL